MNILIICNNAVGLYSFRGMLIKSLIEKGHNVSAIVPIIDGKNELIAEEQLTKLNCSLIHVPIDRRGMNPLKDFKLFRRFKAVIKAEKPELVITYTIKPNIYGGLACRLLKVPYAVNITGLGTAFQHEGLLRAFVTFLYKYALKKAKVVFFENIENRDLMVSSGIIKESKTYVLPGAGVDLDHFSYADYPQDNDGTRFLFIGRIMQEKGVDELFDAMLRLREDGVNCSLDVVGGFEDNYSKVIEKYSNEGWLHYHGFQSDVRPFIANSHCFVLPSWHEGMANTNLECAAMGRPVITSNIHGCLEAVEDGVSGFLCERRNLDSLYWVLKNFSELSLSKKRDMGIQGRERMEQLFDKRIVVKLTGEQLGL